MRSYKKFTLALLLKVLLGVMATSVLAEDVKLPSTISWTAYNTGSSGYNQSVALGKALKDNLGVTLRVIPGKNDVARLAPVRDGKVQFVANGGGTYFASEGVFNFASPDWGPQRLQLLSTATADTNIQLAVAGDLGIKTYKDLKGKRVGIVRGSPALMIGARAHLAFAGLTFKDVKLVEFGGNGAVWKAMLANQVDAAIGSTSSGQTKAMAASPRGIFWPPMPAADKEGWARLHKVAPYFVPHVATLVDGIKKGDSVEGGSYPYPLVTTYANQKADLVYAMTKAIGEQFKSYKDALPEMAGWAKNRQTFKWVVPFHPSAVKYWKEVGVWTDDMQSHNDKLIHRQDVLAKAWATMAGKGLKGDAFKNKWMKVRASALDKAGFDPVWRE